jgi:hypothetical protein
LILFQYVFNTKYKFVPSRPFHGDHIFNPYASIDSSNWKKANFHIHTKEWWGLSNGRKNQSQSVDSLYSYLGYDIINISDYQFVNNFEHNRKYFIPEYEHGYLFPKNHQLVLDTHTVRWLDYLFPETRDNEQSVINTLKADSGSLVAIAHPVFNHAYSGNDIKSISGYDCLEILNQNHFSIQCFDSALSAGRLTYILADDDCHNISDIYQVGRCCTFVNSSVDKSSVLDALKNGKTFGADIYMHDYETNETKQQIIKSLPVLTSVDVKNDTLTVRLSANAKSFTFIGQNGEIKKTVINSAGALYAIQKNDTYVRTQIICDDSTVYYLNPVFRYDGIQPIHYFNVEDKPKTATWRIAGILSLSLIYFLFKKKKKAHLNF